jgi:hypothetical protein
LKSIGNLEPHYENDSDGKTTSHHGENLISLVRKPHFRLGHGKAPLLPPIQD